MADKKISALPAATIPLAGTEVLPIVQSGVTDKVSVEDLTSGRDVSVKKLNATDNVVIGTAGKGIDFSANTHATGMTSELLNDYEEGVWAPTWNGGTVTVSNAFYTKIGRAVTLIADITFGASASGDPATLTVPFTVGSVWGAGSVNFTDVSTTLSVNVDGAANGVLFRTAINAGNEICSNMAGKRVIFSATYFT